MDLVPTAINAAALTAIGLVLALLGKGRFEEVNRRIDDFRAEVNRRFEENDRTHEAIIHRLERSEDKLSGRIDMLQAAVGEMRADLTRVALAVGVGPRSRGRRPLTTD